MNADPVLMQMKYARVIACFSKMMKIPLTEALDIFYKSVTYRLIAEGVADLHCMSDEYLARELMDEYLGPSGAGQEDNAASAVAVAGPSQGRRGDGRGG